MTGGASGIGLATARRMAAHGARVAVPRPRPLRGRGAADRHRLRRHRRRVRPRPAIAAAAERLGGIDVVVNNAGIGAHGTVADNDDAEWHRVLDVNVVGMVARQPAPRCPS